MGLMFTRPTLDAYLSIKYKGFLTKGLSEPELADFDQAVGHL